MHGVGDLFEYVFIDFSLPNFMNVKKFYFVKTESSPLRVKMNFKNIFIYFTVINYMLKYTIINKKGYTQ